MATKIGNVFGSGTGGGSTGPTGPTGATGPTGPSGPAGSGSGAMRGVAVYTGHGPLTSNPPDAQNLDLYFDVDEYTWTVITVAGSTGPTGPSTPTGWRYNWNPAATDTGNPIGDGVVGRDGSYILLAKKDSDGIIRDTAISDGYGHARTIAVLSADSARGFTRVLDATGYLNQSGYWSLRFNFGSGEDFATLVSGENVYVNLSS